MRIINLNKNNKKTMCRAEETNKFSSKMNIRRNSRQRQQAKSKTKIQKQPPQQQQQQSMHTNPNLNQRIVIN